MGQFILIIMVHVGVMGGTSESFTKLWHVYDNAAECKTAALNLTFTKKSGNPEDYIIISSDASCEQYDPKKHKNAYRGIK